MAKISESTEINSIKLKEQSVNPSTPASGYAQLFVKSDGLYLKDDGGNVIGPLVKREDYILIQEQQSAGTNGGTPTLDTWTKRVLNTEVVDNGNHASLANSVITLAAGTYRFNVKNPMYLSYMNRVRLRDTTNGVTLGLSPNLWTDPTNASVTTIATATGRFILSASANLEVQYYATLYQAVNTGLGVGWNIGETEIFASIEFWRES